MDEPQWTAKVVNFWPTLLMQRKLAGFESHNQLLCRSIETLDAEREQLTTNYQGVDLFSNDSPGVQWLKTGVDESVQEYFEALGMDFPITWKLQGWANVNRFGDYHAPHNHGWCYLSGTYYAKMPAVTTESPSAAISFYDPRTSANMLAVPGDKFARHEYTVKPQPGTLLMWHAAVQHLVHPNLSEDSRITISFNVVLEWANHYAGPDVAPGSGFEGEFW